MLERLTFFGATWRPRRLSKSVVSRVIIRVTPFRVLITLLITHLLSPVGLQVGYSAPKFVFSVQSCGVAVELPGIRGESKQSIP